MNMLWLDDNSMEINIRINKQYKAVWNFILLLKNEKNC